MAETRISSELSNYIFSIHRSINRPDRPLYAQNIGLQSEWFH